MWMNSFPQLLDFISSDWSSSKTRTPCVTCASERSSRFSTSCGGAEALCVESAPSNCACPNSVSKRSGDLFPRPTRQSLYGSRRARTFSMCMVRSTSGLLKEVGANSGHTRSIISMLVACVSSTRTFVDSVRHGFHHTGSNPKILKTHGKIGSAKNSIQSAPIQSMRCFFSKEDDILMFSKPHSDSGLQN